MTPQPCPKGGFFLRHLPQREERCGGWWRLGPVALRARLAPDVLQGACELLGSDEKNPMVHCFFLGAHWFIVFFCFLVLLRAIEKGSLLIIGMTINKSVESVRN
jgi:hypothetical protein